MYLHMHIFMERERQRDHIGRYGQGWLGQACQVLLSDCPVDEARPAWGCLELPRGAQGCPGLARAAQGWPGPPAGEPDHKKKKAIWHIFVFVPVWARPSKQKRTMEAFCFFLVIWLSSWRHWQALGSLGHLCIAQGTSGQAEPHLLSPWRPSSKPSLNNAWSVPKFKYAKTSEKLC